MITLHTNFGDIEIELDFDNTPITAKNFLDYAQEGFYNGTIFHRVIKNFMIQGGGMDTDMLPEETKANIENEADKGAKNTRGSLAMARTNDPHSASSQFFINLKDNHFLDFTAKDAMGWGYCVFGQVINGMDVVDKIAEVETTSRYGHDDVPVDNVVIENVVVSEEIVSAE